MGDHAAPLTEQAELFVDAESHLIAAASLALSDDQLAITQLISTRCAHGSLLAVSVSRTRPSSSAASFTPIG